MHESNITDRSQPYNFAQLHKLETNHMMIKLVKFIS